MFVAIYDDLRKGCIHNNKFAGMHGVQYSGQYKINGYSLFSIGHRGVILPTTQEDSIIIDLYQISSEVEKKLDEEYMFKDGVTRKEYIYIKKKRKTIQAAMYIHKYDDEAIKTYPAIQSGDWRDNKWILSNNKLIEF